jgi:hypothetical protein
VETCETAGILATAVNLAASVQATEALKLLTGQPELLRRSLLSFDLWTPASGGSVPRSPPARRARTARSAEGASFERWPGKAAPTLRCAGAMPCRFTSTTATVDLAALGERLAPLGEVRANGLLLRFERPPYTLTVFPDGRALVQGTTDTGLARSLYARYLGA